MKANSKVSRPSILLAGAASFSLLIAAVLYFHPAGAKPPQEEPIRRCQSLSQGKLCSRLSKSLPIYSSQDQLVWDEKSYAFTIRSFTGFALELAQKLAENMEVWVIERQLSPHRAHYKIGYRVPYRR